jgi:hypothetical protein
VPLDHLISALQERLGNREAEGFRGFHVDGELEDRRPLDR